MGAAVAGRCAPAGARVRAAAGRPGVGGRPILPLRLLPRGPRRGPRGAAAAATEAGGRGPGGGAGAAGADGAPGAPGAGEDGREYGHVPVLREEVLGMFEGRRLGTFVDGTLGLAGHAEAVLRAHPECHTFVGIDRDP